mmetsp:Transcript_22670/g.45588  ORF Transcript_22670/g.45588 Transcript_22670/m.45588 type:complete len:115 (+) Transcript_22670:126-470(+)
MFVNLSLVVLYSGHDNTTTTNINSVVSIGQLVWLARPNCWFEAPVVFADRRRRSNASWNWISTLAKSSNTLEGTSGEVSFLRTRQRTYLSSFVAALIQGQKRRFTNKVQHCNLH